MTDKTKAVTAQSTNEPPRLPKWAALTLIGLTAVLVVLLLLLGTSIMQRRWEAQRPVLVAADIDAFMSALGQL